MKEAIVHPGTHVEIINSPVPQPKENQILIKVIYSGSNPKDWKRPDWFQEAHNSGDDIAGIIQELGRGVVGYQVGDRVAALHEMQTLGGSYAEYALSWDYATFHLPDHTSFAEAATIPLAAMTAALGLYQRMRLPPPWNPATHSIPLIIYGGAGAVGSFAIKLAQKSNLHPLIVVAGNSQEYVESLISREKGDTIVDYRDGDEAVVAGIQRALRETGSGSAEARYAYDAITEHNSWRNLSRVLGKDSQLCLVLPQLDFSSVPKYIETHQSAVASIFKRADALTGGHENTDAGFVYFQLFARALGDGWFTGHPYQVVAGGLNGVERGLLDLRAGKNKASKYIFKIAHEI